jgi:hypothetical protein
LNLYERHYMLKLAKILSVRAVVKVDALERDISVRSKVTQLIKLQVRLQSIIL